MYHVPGSTMTRGCNCGTRVLCNVYVLCFKMKLPLWKITANFQGTLVSTTRHVKERLLGTIFQTTAAVTAIGAYKHSRGTGSVN